MIDLLVVSGTRPEYIKLWSVFDLLKNTDHLSIEWRWYSTGQHPDLMKKIEKEFLEKPDFEDTIGMEQSWESKVDEIVKNLVSRNIKTSWVLVQGDTLSAYAGAKWAFSSGKKLIHLEAGMRSGDESDPYPEEIIRKQIAKWTDYHFTVNESGSENLKNESISSDKIVKLSNPLLDVYLAHKPKNETVRIKNKLLIDLHRRRLDSEQEQLENALSVFFENLPNEIDVHWLGHPNQKNIPDRVKTIPPMDYREVLECLSSCDFVLTDSGGLQLEAIWSGAKTGLLRDKTEWPEFEKQGGKILGLDGSKWVDFLGEKKQSNQDLKSRFKTEFTMNLRKMIE